MTHAAYGKQVAILLGSGASIQYIPGTTAVTAALKKWTKYYMPPTPRIGFPEILDRIEYDGTPAQARYFESLYNALAPSFNSPLEFLHFERLLHIAQGLDHHTSENNIDGSNDYLKVGPGPLSTLNAANPGMDNRIHGMVASAATTFILNHIAMSETSAANQNDLTKDPLNRFLAKLSKDVYLRLFSLNYDTVPLHSGVSFESGFRKLESASTVESFYPSQVRTAYRSHVFCQLHGSSLFGYASGDQSARGSLVRYPTLQKAMESRKSIAVGNHLSQDGVEGLSQLMITGLRKADAILHDPFATYFSRLLEDLISCDAVLVVGYGGADNHVNELFRRMYEAKADHSRVTRLAWIGYSAPNGYVNGTARDGIETGPWQSLSQAAPILPRNYLGNMRPVGAASRLRKLQRNTVNRFENDRVAAAFCLQGSNDAFAEQANEVRHFLLGS